MSPFSREGTVYRFPPCPPRPALLGQLPSGCQVSVDLITLAARGWFDFAAVSRAGIAAEILALRVPLATNRALEELRSVGREPCGPAELLGFAIAHPDAMRQERKVAALEGVLEGGRAIFLWGSVQRRGVGYSLPGKIWRPGDGFLVRV